MTTTTTPETTAPTARGFGCLPCPLCGAEATVRLDLDDLQHFTCCECDEQFTAEDLRERMAKWQRVLAWIDLAPAAE